MNYRYLFFFIILSFLNVLSCKDSQSFLSGSSNVKKINRQNTDIQNIFLDYKLHCEHLVAVDTTQNEDITLHENLKFTCMIINKDISSKNLFFDFEKDPNISWLIINRNSETIPFTQEIKMNNFLNKVVRAITFSVNETNSENFTVSANYYIHEISTDIQIIKVIKQETKEDSLFQQKNTTGSENTLEIEGKAVESKCRPNPFPGEEDICD